MSAFISQTGIGKEAYQAARAWFGHFKGGLAIATVFACALFAACAGTSLAGTVVMGQAAFPEMRRLGYSERLSAAVISAGGTLGVLIPPSMGFIMIGILTDLSIGKLFMAGILPGITVVIFYSLTILIWCRINKNLAPSAISIPWKERFWSIRLTWPAVLLFILIMGGLYGGVFTPTEAAAVGAFGAFVIPMAKRQMTPKIFWTSLVDTATMSGMIVAMIIGAFLFNSFITITQIPTAISDFIAVLQVNRWIIMAIIIIFYVIAGMFFDVLAVALLTIPILFPVVDSLGFNLIWYSVIMVRVIEIGMITPPFGINLFGLAAIVDVKLGTLYRGIMPFVIFDLLNVVLLCFFPIIATYLPSRM